MAESGFLPAIPWPVLARTHPFKSGHLSGRIGIAGRNFRAGRPEIQAYRSPPLEFLRGKSAIVPVPGTQVHAQGGPGYGCGTRPVRRGRHPARATGRPGKFGNGLGLLSDSTTRKTRVRVAKNCACAKNVDEIECLRNFRVFDLPYYSKRIAGLIGVNMTIAETLLSRISFTGNDSCACAENLNGRGGFRGVGE